MRIFSHRVQTPPINPLLRPSQTIHNSSTSTVVTSHDNSDTQERDIASTAITQPNAYIGNTLSLPKNNNITRIYCQNVNGISLTNPGTWDVTCEHLRDMEVNVALLTEHKLDTTQPKVMKRLYDDARKVLGMGTFTINASSTPITSATMFKPGGVLSMAIGDIKGRILESGNDPLGRWVYTKFRRSTGPPITIIMTYQVVDVDPRHLGPMSSAILMLHVRGSNR